MLGGDARSIAILLARARAELRTNCICVARARGSGKPEHRTNRKRAPPRTHAGERFKADVARQNQVEAGRQ